MAEKEIVLKNVSKVYDNGVYAVRDINLEIQPGEFIIFVGPSGCGKSTILRMIAGLEEISSGELWIGNLLANFMEPKERDLSMVFQNYALYPNMNVYKNIAFSLEIRGVPQKEVKEKVHNVAMLLELETVLNRRPKDLSGGQRQRVAIGNAVIRNPDILLMDEPLSNLDAKLRGQMRVELSRLHKSLGNTIVYVTHDQTEAMTLGTRIVVMKKGEIQQVDTPKTLYENPVNRFVAEFIGSPSINILECEARVAGDILQLKFGEQWIDCDSKIAAWMEGKKRQKILAGIRPEAFLDEGKRKKHLRKDLPDEQALHVKILHRELLGDEVILYFELCKQTCAMRVSADNACRIGERIKVWVDASAIHLFDAETEENILFHHSKYKAAEGGIRL